MPDIWAVAHCAETHCLAEAPGKVPYLCTEWPNHDGWHRAELDEELLDTWPAKPMLSIVVTWKFMEIQDTPAMTGRAG